MKNITSPIRDVEKLTLELYEQQKISQNHYKSLETLTEKEVYLSLYDDGLIPLSEVPQHFREKGKKESPLLSNSKRENNNVLNKLKSLFRQKNEQSENALPEGYDRAHAVLKNLWGKKKITLEEFKKNNLLSESDMYLSLYDDGYLSKEEVPSYILKKKDELIEPYGYDEAFQELKDAYDKGSISYDEFFELDQLHIGALREALHYNPKVDYQDILVLKRDREAAEAKKWEEQEVKQKPTPTPSPSTAVGNESSNHVSDKKGKEIKKPDGYSNAVPVLKKLYDKELLSDAEFATYHKLPLKDMYQKLVRDGLIGSNEIPSEYKIEEKQVDVKENNDEEQEEVKEERVKGAQSSRVVTDFELKCWIESSRKKRFEGLIVRGVMSEEDIPKTK